MPRFFKHLDAPAAVGDLLHVEGQDAAHIRLSLRMSVGDRVTLCDGKGYDYDTVIDAVSEREVTLRVCAIECSQSEPSVQVTVYQGYPKGDKLELIIQKAVELGAARIVPVVTSRSIAKPGDKADKKQARWQQIADEAAGQCGRGILPEVSAPLTFAQALAEMRGQKLLGLYEAGGQPLSSVVDRDAGDLVLFIGPEGGISPDELQKLQEVGGTVISLGRRILRCETAPLAALAAVMTLTGNLE